MSQGLKLAAGSNVAAISLVDITTIKPTSDENFADPKSLPLYNDGAIKIAGDGSVFVQGYAVQPWYFTRMTYRQLLYLRDTYCAGGLSGNVTVLVNIEGSFTLTRMNAVLVLPKPTDDKSLFWYKDLTINFTRLRVAS